MSNPDPNDEQGLAEALDEEVLGADVVEDVGEDVVRATFPPDGPVGLDPEPEPFGDEVPDVQAPPDEPIVGLIRPDDAAGEEVAELGEQDPLVAAEEAAVHEAAPPPERRRDGDLDEGA